MKSLLKKINQRAATPILLAFVAFMLIFLKNMTVLDYCFMIAMSALLLTEIACWIIWDNELFYDVRRILFYVLIGVFAIWSFELYWHPDALIFIKILYIACVALAEVFCLFAAYISVELLIRHLRERKNLTRGM